MSFKVDQVPRPPAAAYRFMEAQLPAWYFLQPPPSSGVHLTVVGNDGRTTEWDLSRGMAPPIMDAIEASPKVRLARVTPFGEG